jgi:3'-phosphoadenosine 5'-phosphosulfate sulfotransferase (PAPS reductase)/FAD synthetase
MMTANEAKIDAMRILDEARREHFGDHHRMTAAVVLFSGGNDSTVLAHLMRPHCSHFGHANTGIGVEQTRQFVRDVAEDWGIPLLERHPPPGDTFEEMVQKMGFPGPGQHFRAYQRLKERAIRQMRRELVADPRKERVLFIAGRRRAESSRRKEIPESEREGSAVWVSPLANWSDANMAEYRSMHTDLPHNEVTDHLHMSGECLCGAFAKHGEIHQIEMFYPDVAEEIRRLEILASAAGIPKQHCQWGWGAYRDDPDRLNHKSGPMCSSCEFRNALGMDPL